ncbi:methionyl-tRNA formyltransferase [Alkalihalobacterium chitinilyticum]|uniref:Methionyl-tRNA formyltransferase n=1 Tax=Alkalihalobacterium chitinilyticum TaxID=2980103 RepID=A0ABT5VC44_9BACI|nr:methionyl-tRNA formyltransferase [Alkalihalobacterium chitinilyticum]MDE5413019.1 methionyl-tRNA formyltransferase [Alkalihalobacterium chitinilyticum]
MRIVFMGTPDFSVPVLRQLIEDGYEVAGVVTQPDRPKGRKRVLTPPPVKVEAEKHGLTVLQPEKIKEKEELDKVLALNPDLIVTAAFGQILPKEILETPKYGCINVHASLLPKYRGGAPIHKSIIDGQKETGITIMYMVEKLDAGDILTQTVVPIEEEDHVGSLHNTLSAAGAKLLSETIPPLIRGELQPIVQNDEEVTYAWNITREQEKIDWNKPGEEIYNQIRGLHPWPVAFTTFGGQPMKIWWGQKTATTQKVEPGTVIAVEEDGFIVATGNETAIKVTDLQPAGKKRMLAGQFLRGAGITTGDKLGD